jgi:hypothetical protein
VDAGKIYTIKITLKNTSDVTWPSKGIGEKHTNRVGISYHWLNADGDQVIVKDGLRTLLPHDIPPGETLTIDKVRVRAPDKSGSYRLQMTLVQEGVAWFDKKGASTVTKQVTVR